MDILPPANSSLVAVGRPWLVSDFYFRTRLSFSIPARSGPRGITPFASLELLGAEYALR